MFRDSFYTPRILAEKLVGFIKKSSFENVADFCVGDGELLRAAKSRWPKIKCYGSDISVEAVEETKLKHPDWSLSQIDFLDPSKRINAEIFHNQSKFQLILLNPPFSCRGGTLHVVKFEGETFSVSTSMHFLVTALEYLENNGVLYAILPTSTAYSQKDKQLWSMLEKRYNLSILEEPSINYFKGCAANVILISLNDFSQTSRLKNSGRVPLSFKDIEVFRGKLSMDQIVLNSGKHFLIHSTNIRNNTIVNLSIKQNHPLSQISGPAILIPRVGKPKKSKICIIPDRSTFILSDCIIAIKTNTFRNADVLYRYMLDNWDLIEGMYKGTGAKYITIEKVKQFLNLDIENRDIQIAKAI